MATFSIFIQWKEKSQNLFLTDAFFGMLISMKLIMIKAPHLLLRGFLNAEM